MRNQPAKTNTTTKTNVNETNAETYFIGVVV